ncbi:MAG TPA: flagellar biosynthetic protein FliO [Caulobacter sp.]|nr:flagellar biosynthetic protein FliO [Caulobacter sp.]
MDLFAGALRAVFALLVTLGLIGLAAVAMRKFGPEALSRLQANRKHRRLVLVESLMLDPARRLVLIRLDDEERLVLLGEGRMLETLKKSPAPRRKAPEIAA